MSRPFFPKQSKSQVSAFDNRIAVKLHSILKRREPRFQTKVSWSHVIRLMRQRDNYSESRIETLLQWFAVHHKDEYTPRVYNATIFRQKFKALEAAMSRDPPVDSKPKISDKAKSIQSSVQYEWPFNQKKKELLFIQSCLDNYRDFKTKLKQVRDHDPNLVDYLLSDLPSAESLVRLWLYKVWNYFWWCDANHPEIKIKLKRHVFHYSSKRFREIITPSVSLYCGQTRRWDRLVEAMRNL